MPRGIHHFAGLLAGLLLFAANAAANAPSPSSPAYGIRIDEAWITLPDGVRLSADLYMPTGGAARERHPVLLEYLPYRKRESRNRDYAMYSYFVQRGYVVAAVDIRGTGNSEGRLIPYEYSDIEQQDGEVVIDWLSKQPWSNGKVGMFGISWGGFNSIQMAARHPPALKAIIAVDATDDLYQDDVHFMDGIMHVDSWEMSMDLDNSRPGAPDYVIDDDNFRNRFDTDPWMLTYKVQQRDGPFWDRASTRDRLQDIRIPAFFIGGWYDGYRDSVPRMLANVNAPVKAIMGAWSHAWPHDPYPNPGMEWRHEAVRWFDQWLRGVDTGILDEPRLAVYVRNWHAPGPYLAYAPGSWRYEDGWPIARIREQVLYPQDDHTLKADAPAASTHRLRYLPSIGIEAGGPVMWWGDVAHDQRPTDAYSLTYDSEPLAEDTGNPRPAARHARRVRRCPARQLDGAAVRRRARRHGDPSSRRGIQRQSSALGALAFCDRAGRGIHDRYRNALHVMGIPQGAPHPPRGQQCAVAHAMADTRSDDDDAAARRLAAVIAGRAVREAPGARFPAAGEGSTDAGLRNARCRHQLRLRRDLFGRSQSADGRGDGDRHQQRRLSLSLGHGALSRDHPPRCHGRRTRQGLRARHAPDGS